MGDLLATQLLAHFHCNTNDLCVSGHVFKPIKFGILVLLDIEMNFF
jgi:hypothetical protein